MEDGRRLDENTMAGNRKGSEEGKGGRQWDKEGRARTKRKIGQDGGGGEQESDGGERREERKSGVRRSWGSLGLTHEAKT